MAGVLAPMGLRLSPEKTRVVHIDEGFDFLGFHIRRRRKRGTQKQCVYTTPSKKAVQAAKDKVRQKTRRSTLHLSLAGLITSLNQTLRGWATYFRHGVSTRVFHHLDNHAWWRIVGWIRAKYQGKNRVGWKELRRRFCDQGWRLAHDGVVFTGASSVAVTRYRYRGSTIAYPMDPDTGSRHRRLTNGQDTWRARCVERRTPGSAGGPRKPTSGNPGRALRADPTAGLCPGRGSSGPTPSGDGRLTEGRGTSWRSCSTGSPVWMSARTR